MVVLGLVSGSDAPNVLLIEAPLGLRCGFFRGGGGSTGFLLKPGGLVFSSVI